MSSDQLFLPNMPVHPMDEAIQKIRDLALPHNNYLSFVREVAEKVLGYRSGSTILCAAPSDINCSELIAKLIAETERRYRESRGTEFPGIQVVSTPSALRRGGSAVPLINAYHHPIAKPDAQQRFQLEFAEAFKSTDQFHVVSNLLKHAPITACIVRNVHSLQPAGYRVEPALDAVFMLVDMAEQSKCTHVLIGHTATVLGWLKHPDLARSVSASVLLPYDVLPRPDKTHLEDEAHLRAVLEAYDTVVPWASGESLIGHYYEVDSVISGSPHRLRTWLIDSLCKAKAESESFLAWRRFISVRPSAPERKQAWRELDSVREYLERDTACVTNAQPSATAPENPGPSTPGVRSPTRDSVAA